MKNIADFSNRLKQQRKNLGLTQAQVAEKCGITMRMWGNYERGLNSPSAEIIFLLQELGFDASYLFGDSELPVPALSTDEQELLEVFRQLNSNDQYALKRQAQFLLSSMQEERQSSQTKTKNIKVGKIGQVIKAENIENIQGNKFKF